MATLTQPKPPPAMAIAIMGMVGFFVLASYGLARPAVEALFLQAFDSRKLPASDLLVSLSAFVTVLIYNRWADRRSVVTMFLWVSGLTVGLLVALLLVLPADQNSSGGRAVIGALYLWKELYIVFLIEIFWTYSNTVFRLKTARWIYGVFMLVGTAGSLVANKAVGPLAHGLGNVWILWIVAPILVFGMALFFGIDRYFGITVAAAPKEGHRGGFEVVRRSEYLGLMVALIACSQMVILLIRWQFLDAAASTYDDTAARTEFIGGIYFLINLASAVLNAGAGTVVRALGVGRTLVAIPAMLAGFVMASMVAPAFLILSQVFSKGFDYSLFRVAKELLYLPLGHAEKTQGKAIVDIMTYRVSKALAAVALLALIGLGDWLGGIRGGGSLAHTCIAVATLLFLALWVVITRRTVGRYRRVRDQASS